MENLIYCACCNDLLTEENPVTSENRVEDFAGDLRYLESFCADCTEDIGRMDAYDDHDHDDEFDVESALGSAGMGTDEFYTGYIYESNDFHYLGE